MEAIYRVLVPNGEWSSDGFTIEAPLMDEELVLEVWARASPLLSTDTEFRYVVHEDDVDAFEALLRARGLRFERREEEMSLPTAAELFDIAYPSLAQAAREGRVAARTLGRQWFVTANAIREAIATGRIRPRNLEEVMARADELTDHGRHAPPGMEGA